MYQKTNWQSGDTITAEKLNNIENGIAGGGVLVVNYTTACDKTWQEIDDAAFAVIVANDDVNHIKSIELVGITGINGSAYAVMAFNAMTGTSATYSCDSADGYPVKQG